MSVMAVAEPSVLNPNLPGALLRDRFGKRRPPVSFLGLISQTNALSRDVYPLSWETGLLIVFQIFST